MKRILIIRPTAIGDIVMASPMLRTLRDAWPGAYIAWLAEPSVGDLLREHPLLDEIIYWPKARCKALAKKGRLIQLAREMKKVRDKMRRGRFDLAIDAQGLFRSRFLAWLSKAPERIGFQSGEPGEWLMTNVISRGPKNQRMSSEYRYLMEELGLSPGAFHPEIHAPETDARSARGKLDAMGVGAAYAVISPFTTRPWKHWLDDRWAELADRIERRRGLPVVMLGGPGDVSRGKVIRDLAGTDLYDLTGKTTLGESVSVIEKATLVMGVDTGLTHMGLAFRRPTIAIFGATRPYLYTPGDNTVILYNHLPCSPCRRRPTCAALPYPCMDSIRVEQALAAVDSLLYEKAETKAE
ncbi:MAG: glycosyltransferase family 9 protein [Desulfobacterales bacterium]|nr:glycosyltransferase family 9 protein [Desulfobacterales bacterium]